MCKNGGSKKATLLFNAISPLNIARASLGRLRRPGSEIVNSSKELLEELIGHHHRGPHLYKEVHQQVRRECFQNLLLLLVLLKKSIFFNMF